MAGSPESNYFSQGSAIHSSGGEGRARVEKPREPSLPHRPEPPAPTAPGGARRGWPRTRARRCLWDYLSFRARPLGRGAGVVPAEWQISRGLSPPRAPSHRRRARPARGSRTPTAPNPCLRRTAAPHPAHAPRPRRRLGRTRASAPGLLQVGPGPCLLGPWMLLSKVKVK